MPLIIFKIECLSGIPVTANFTMQIIFHKLNNLTSLLKPQKEIKSSRMKFYLLIIINLLLYKRVSTIADYFHRLCWIKNGFSKLSRRRRQNWWWCLFVDFIFYWSLKKEFINFVFVSYIFPENLIKNWRNLLLFIDLI